MALNMNKDGQEAEHIQYQARIFVDRINECEQYGQRQQANAHHRDERVGQHGREPGIALRIFRSGKDNGDRVLQHAKGERAEKQQHGDAGNADDIPGFQKSAHCIQPQVSMPRRKMLRLHRHNLKKLLLVHQTGEQHPEQGQQGDRRQKNVVTHATSQKDAVVAHKVVHNPASKTAMCASAGLMGGSSYCAGSVMSLFQGHCARPQRYPASPPDPASAAHG